MKDRIHQIMLSEGLSNIEFANKIDISTSSLSHIFNGRNKPSLDVVMHIHSSYPDISLNWLLYGEGEMKIRDLMLEQQENCTYSETNNGINQLDNQGNIRENTTNNAEGFENRKEMASERAFSAPKEIVKQEIKYVEKPSAKITEIRIFFDNGTYETFKPDNSSK